MNRRACLTGVALIALATSLVPPAASAQEAVADSVRKYKFLGKTARDKDDHADVVKYYTSLLRFEGDYQPGYYYIARAQLALGDQEAAKRALLSAHALKPDHANTNLLLFQIYAGQSRPDSAWTYLQPLAQDNPNDTKYLDYRRTIADLFRRDGDNPSAIGHYEAIATDPATPEATRQELYELLAVMFDDAGDAARALEWRQKLADAGGAGRVESLTKMVDLQVQTKDYKAAFQTLKELTKIDSAGRYSHFHRISELGGRAGDPAMELAGLEGMARTQPRDLETVATIAQMQLNGNNLKAAETWLLQGLKTDPADAQLRVLHGDLLMRQKAPEDTVIAEYTVALEDPNWASVAQQRIWQIRPPETEEEKLRKEFFGQGGTKSGGG